MAKTKTGKASKTKARDTPLMKQYNQIKAKHPGAVLFFRVGDFYETFGEDAIKTADALGIVLTKKSAGTSGEVELAGFPHHALDSYLPKMIKAGYRVAICEQLEDPKKAKTLVKRGVTEIITPGLTVNDKLLDYKKNNFLAAIHFEKDRTGMAILDISTGELYATEGSPGFIRNLLKAYHPAEILVSKQRVKGFLDSYDDGYYHFALDDWVFERDYALEKLLLHFETESLKGFGVADMTAGIVASGVLFHHLKENQLKSLDHVRRIRRIVPDGGVWLDQFSIRNLELLRPIHGSGKALIDIMDMTSTAMGSRLLRKWMVRPLLDLEKIKMRHEAVETLVKDEDQREIIGGFLSRIGDLERMVSRLSMRRIGPRELQRLGLSLAELPALIKSLEPLSGFRNQLDRIGEHIDASDRILHALVDEPPALIQKGGIFKPGIDDELDELKHLSSSSKEFLVHLQQQEIENTGIPSLKIGFNNVFGYYFEVRNTHKDKVPDEWVRKQTLTNAERYITSELKEYEEKILGADTRILEMELVLFDELIDEIAGYVGEIQDTAEAVAEIDVLHCFANLAIANKYRKPEVDDGMEILITEGRHPVIEKQLEQGDPFIPNDIRLNDEDHRLLIITGPNMAGKSAVLRQTALIVLMAQMGSFIPARAAKIGLVDRVFTRVGASDNISSGESTFMVEMHETASILNNVTDRSLILLDEIGRGTSTFDGISIAWSVAEYIISRSKAKTLFATHYHELSELESKWDGIANYNVATRESGQKVIFLRKLERGECGHSFGIHVAGMAGMPQEVIKRAEEILEQLEEKGVGDERVKLQKMPKEYQLSIFEAEDAAMVKIKQELKALNINDLTPVQALIKLQDLKKDLES